MSTDRRILLGRVAGDFGVRGELKLISWTEHPDECIKHFSGTATYRKTIPLEKPKPGTKLLLDLGKFEGVMNQRERVSTEEYNVGDRVRKGQTLATVNPETVAADVAQARASVAEAEAGKNMQQNDVVTTTERRCRTVKLKSQRLVGYDVTYRLEGQDGQVRTSFQPGATLPVKDGRVVITPPTGMRS